MKTLYRLMGLGSAMIAAAAAPAQGDACTRVIYEGADSLYIIGRSLDWKTPIPTNLYVYPAGIEKQGSSSVKGINWVSKYGAVYAVGYDGGITEGMNEKGLSVNGLFCKGTIYSNEEREQNPPISLAMIVGWILDTCATTDEVETLLTETPFKIEGATFDGGTVSTLHWGVTDASGKSIIFEFDKGNLKISDPGDFRAMTNDPQWESMSAILAYWDKIGGQHFLPGTVTSADRCVRANYFAHHVNPVVEADLGAAITRSILVNSSVPYTYNIVGEPNLSSTQWRSYSNLRDKLYYFDIVTNPGYYYVDLKKCDLTPNGKILKLNTEHTQDLVGDVTDRLEKSDGFTPMY
ncbi:MAG: linear amide C-N hydrolase [Bacteroidales bacterium]|nr:linear amide C-N hydrolase [Bacteroidales bacterium]